MEILAPTILVVDDEPTVALVATICLTRAGYRVLAANTVAQAMALWNNDVALLLTDFIMPDLSGDKLAARLLLMNPNLKVVIMSGTPFAARSTVFQSNGLFQFLQKPFGMEELLAVVDSLLRSKVAA